MRPQLRFPGFADAWVEKKLGEFADFYSGNGLNKNVLSADGKQECILYGNLYTDYGMITDTITCHTNIDIKNPVYSKFGDVLIPASDTTPTGIARATSVEKEGVLLGSDINIIRPKSGIHGSCLSLSINANKAKMSKYIKGITVRHIHNSDIKELKISIPANIKEQELLAIYFKNLDRLITLNKHKLSSMKEYKKSMLQRMFPKAGNLPELRFPGFSDEWVEKQVKEVATIVGGNSWKHSDYKNNGDYLVVTISNVSGDNFINDKIGNRLFCDPDNAYILNENDILISLTGNVGRVSNMTAAKGVLNQRVGKVIPNENIVPNFLFYQLNNPRFESTMVYAGQGGAQKNISNSDVLSYSITTPQSKTEQSLIGSFFSNLDRLITLQSQKLSALDLYKKALLQRMFA